MSPATPADGVITPPKTRGRPRKTPVPIVEDPGTVDYRLGQHHARLGALEEGQSVIDHRLEEVILNQGQLALQITQSMGEAKDASIAAATTAATAIEQNRLLGEQLTTLVQDIKEERKVQAPMWGFVAMLMARAATVEAASKQRHEQFIRRYNVLLPMVIAIFVSLFIPKISQIPQAFRDNAQTGILVVAGLYICVSLLYSFAPKVSSTASSPAPADSTQFLPPPSP